MPIGAWLAVSPVENMVIAPLCLTRPIAPGDPPAVNHTLASGPAVMSCGVPVAPLNSVMTPAVVTRPIAPPGAFSVNHRLPSCPAVMSSGALPEFRPPVYSVTAPCGVMRPIAGGVASSVNQRFPSGPDVMPVGALPPSPDVYSVMTPWGVMRPIRDPPGSVNQRFPSGPLVIALGALVRPVRYSVIVPEAEILPIPALEFSVNHTSPFGPLAASLGPLWLVSPAVNSVIVGAAHAGGDHRAETAKAIRPAADRLKVLRGGRDGIAPDRLRRARKRRQGRLTRPRSTRGRYRLKRRPASSTHRQATIRSPPDLRAPSRGTLAFARGQDGRGPRAEGPTRRSRPGP